MMHRHKRLLAAAALILTFLLMLLPAAPALAYTEYGQMYDATDLLDENRCRTMEQQLSDLSEKQQVDIHVDVVEDLEGQSIDDYARIFYMQYGYGNETTRDGILLMIYLEEDADGLEYQDHDIVYGGQNKEALRGIVGNMVSGIAPYLNEDAFAGDIEEDNDAFFHAVEAVISAAGGAAEQIEEAQTAAETEAQVQAIAPSGQAAVENVTPLDQVDSSSLTLDQLGGLYVLDGAGLMTEEQKSDLESKAQQLADTYGVGIYVLTVDDYRSYGGDSNIDLWTEKLYKDNQLGLGSEQNGVLLVLSMAERDYCLKIYGQDALFAYTDYAQGLLTERFLSSFKNNDWYGGFSKYMEFGGTILEEAQDGSPMEKYVNWAGLVGASGILSAIIGMVTGSGRVSRLKRTMKNTGIRTRAHQYISKDAGLRLHVQNDHYINTSVTRTLVRSDDDRSSGGGSGGGGTTIDSNGFSGGSGKF